MTSGRTVPRSDDMPKKPKPKPQPKKPFGY
jgi:hypothetical protein